MQPEKYCQGYNLLRKKTFGAPGEFQSVDPMQHQQNPQNRCAEAALHSVCLQLPPSVGGIDVMSIAMRRKLFELSRNESSMPIAHCMETTLKSSSSCRRCISLPPADWVSLATISLGTRLTREAKFGCFFYLVHIK